MGKDGSLKVTPQELGTKDVCFLGTVANEDKLEKKNYHIHAFFVHMDSGLQRMQSSLDVSRSCGGLCMPSSGREAIQGKSMSAREPTRRAVESLCNWEMNRHKP